MHGVKHLPDLGENNARSEHVIVIYAMRMMKPVWSPPWEPMVNPAEDTRSVQRLFGASPATGQRWPCTRLALVTILLLVLMGLSGCNNVFFQPDNRLYFLPQRFGLWHEEVGFNSADGTRLFGWFLPGKPPLKGTVIHFHGNAANISNHLYAVRWMPPQGYSVFLFDYRGYGRSEGSANRLGAIEDGAAAIQYVRGRSDVDPNRLFIYGQSLGGALAVSALTRAGAEGVRALVVEGTFSSYQDLVRMKMDDSWVTWLFQYPVAYGLFTDSYAPYLDLPALSAVPLLVIHGERDGTVPYRAGVQFYKAFPGEERQFMSVPYADHMRIFNAENSPWRPKLLGYLESRLPKTAYQSRVAPGPAGGTSTSAKQRPVRLLGAPPPVVPFK